MWLVSCCFDAGHPVQMEVHLAHILLPVVSAGAALLVLILLFFLRRQQGMFAPWSNDILRAANKGLLAVRFLPQSNHETKLNSEQPP